MHMIPSPFAWFSLELVNRFATLIRLLYIHSCFARVCQYVCLCNVPSISKSVTHHYDA